MDDRDRKINNNTRVSDLRTISQCNRARVQLMHDIEYWQGQIDQGQAAEHAHFGIFKLKLTLRLKQEVLVIVQDRLTRMRAERDRNVES